MNKINFVNNQAPYLNADNLNQLQTNVENAIKKTYNLERGTSIPANINLNNYTTVGCYYVNDGTIAQTLTNAPIVDNGFKLVVENTTGTNFIRQTILGRGGSAQTYVRTYNSTSWGEWKLISYSINITTGQEFATHEVIDSKRVYGKIFYINGLPNNNYTDINLGLTLSNVEVYKIYGTVKSNAGNIFLIDSNLSSATVNVNLMVSTNKLRITTYNDNFINGTGHITIYYTKNT